MSEKAKKLKCYVVENICCEDAGIVGVAAYTSKEAAAIARNTDTWDGCEYIFVNTRPKLRKDIDVTDLPWGEIDIVDGLKKGIYGAARCVDCEVCERYIDEDEIANLVNNEIMCQECEDKFLLSKNSQP